MLIRNISTYSNKEFPTYGRQHKIFEKCFGKMSEAKRKQVISLNAKVKIWIGKFKFLQWWECKWQ